MKGGGRGISPLPLPPYGRWGVEIALIIMFSEILLLTIGILLTLHNDFVYSYLPEYLNIFLSSNSFWLVFRFFLYVQRIYHLQKNSTSFLPFCMPFLKSYLVLPTACGKWESWPWDNKSRRAVPALFNNRNECNHLYLILHFRGSCFKTSTCCLMLAYTALIYHLFQTF